MIQPYLFSDVKGPISSRSMAFVAVEPLWLPRFFPSTVRLVVAANKV